MVSLHSGQVVHQVGAYLRFLWHEYFVSSLIGMPAHRRVTPSIKFAGTHWVERGTCPSVLPKNTTQCPPAKAQPGPLDPESSALTIRPPRLPVIRYNLRIFTRIYFLIKKRVFVSFSTRR